jgi:hypothetical protein
MTLDTFSNFVAGSRYWEYWGDSYMSQPDERPSPIQGHGHVPYEDVDGCSRDYYVDMEAWWNGTGGSDLAFTAHGANGSAANRTDGGHVQLPGW